MFKDILTQAGILAQLSLLVALTPMVMGVVYALRPSEARLALMRPLSLASMFAGLCGLSSGLVNILRYIALSSGTVPREQTMLGLSEAIVPLFVAFGCLTVGWLCVAFGMTRQT